MSDRKKLIHSIFQRYPVPSIFLWRSSENGRLVYHVLDGKQRLESILMFQRLRWFRSDGFSVRTRVEGDDTDAEWDWGRLQRKGYADRLMGYEFQTVEVSGDDLSEVIALFVLINSTGKRLTGAERRHAKYFRTPFLKLAEKLARRHERYFLETRIISEGQRRRMKHMELTCELLASIHVNGLIDKKRALDELISGQTIDGRSLHRCVREFVRVLNRVKRMFPKLGETRFANTADFYSLFLVVHDLERSGCILTDRRRNEQAQRLLIWLSSGVDAVRDQVRKAEGARPDQRLFADYLMTVRADADSRATRKRRSDLLQALFGNLFDKKDKQRGFTPEQRRLIWHSDESKRCPGCGDLLTWENFTIDHIRPHALGGPSNLPNSRLMCSTCNSRRGAARRARRHRRRR